MFKPGRSKTLIVKQKRDAGSVEREQKPEVSFLSLVCSVPFPFILLLFSFPSFLTSDL